LHIELIGGEMWWRDRVSMIVSIVSGDFKGVMAVGSKSALIGGNHCWEDDEEESGEGDNVQGEVDD